MRALRWYWPLLFLPLGFVIRGGGAAQGEWLILLLITVIGLQVSIIELLRKR